MTELNVLLKLLDHETLSCATEEKKTAVKNLLRQLQPSGISKISFSNGYYLVQAGFSGWTTSQLTLKLLESHLFAEFRIYEGKVIPIVDHFD